MIEGMENKGLPKQATKEKEQIYPEIVSVEGIGKRLVKGRIYTNVHISVAERWVKDGSGKIITK